VLFRSPREAKVLRMRFGIDMNTDHTLEEVGKQFDVTRERIRQAIRLAGQGAISAEALEDAASALKRSVPGLEIALCIAPSAGFDPDGDEAGEILERLGTAGIGLCFLALGAPRQEMLALRGRSQVPGVGFASVGAGLDFLGGHQRRAPRLMRWLRVEWLWRALSSPLRLGPRYAKCLVILPGQVVQALRLRGSGN